MDLTPDDEDASEVRPLLASEPLATAPYAKRPPSPPYILIPSVMVNGRDVISAVPSYENTDTTQLTPEQYSIITNNKEQVAREAPVNWRYEARRRAQPVLDFLYLGPMGAARDREFLVREGITMLLAVRDSSIAQARLMRLEALAQELGIVADYVDVLDHQQLMREFSKAVHLINDHLLAFNSKHAAGGDGDLPSGAGSRRGKVLVFCETGNDRSAAIVAAYIMSMFGMSMVKTIQFVSLQRFCTNFDEETKQWLKSYDDILEARRSVTRTRQQEGLGSSSYTGSRNKRTIEDSMDTDTEHQHTTDQAAPYDNERFELRTPFVPFIDPNDQRPLPQ